MNALAAIADRQITMWHRCSSTAPRLSATEGSTLTPQVATDGCSFSGALPTGPGKFDTARRSPGRPNDYEGVTHPQVRPDPALGLLKLYDDALPHVYGYLLARCGDTGLAEDLTAESFLAAVHAVRKPGALEPSIPWLIGVARHKLADHWRRVEREQRGLSLLDGQAARVEDPWETVVDRMRAREVLDRLGAHHRAALTLRYLDGLPVPEVARHLNRSLHATEALLVRARAAFRQVCEREEGSP
jgi:RNA polymerase sigma-70 factor, ECF subfamily